MSGGWRRFCSWRSLVIAALIWAAALFLLSMQEARRFIPIPIASSSAPAIRVVQPLAPELGAGKLLTSTSAVTSPPTAAAVETTRGADVTKETPNGDVPPIPSAPRRGVGERDYSTEPIQIWFNAVDSDFERTECDIRCKILRQSPSNKIDGYMAWFSPRAPPGKDRANHSSFVGMESPAIYPEYLRQSGLHDVVGYTSLTTDVPLLYPSWTDFDFWSPPRLPKGHIRISFISATLLSDVLVRREKQMMDNGVTVDSYGQCMHNKDFTAREGPPWKIKVTTLEQYKFTLAFENSNYEDYVTEKLFQAFLSGSIPLHMGFKSIHRFGPSPKSIISLHDFPSPTEFSAYVLEVSRNVTLWNEYISWKKTGSTKEFNGIMNIASVHTQCRVCIRMADIDRRAGTPPVEKYWEEDLASFPPSPLPGSLFVRVRNRGYFYFRWIYVPRRTYAALVEAVMNRFRGIEKIPPQPVPGYGTVKVVTDDLYYIYKLPLEKLLRGPKPRIITDADVAALNANDELELVWNWSPFIETQLRKGKAIP